MNTSNLTPTKLFLGVLFAVLIGIALSLGFSKKTNSASEETSPAEPTAHDKTTATPETPTSNTTTMTGLETDKEIEEREKFVEFDTPHLKKGRDIWLANCENCHAWGTAGAPIPMEPDAWRNRVIKERELLYDHAINGFFGPGDTMMPARGGNEALTDEEVKSAVDYMVTLAEHYIKSEEN